jgi:hypothetical protein
MQFSAQIPKSGHHDATLLFFRCSKCGRAATETRVERSVNPDRAVAHADSRDEVADIKLRNRQRRASAA